MEFNSPTNPEKVWKISLKTQTEMKNIFYKDNEPKNDEKILGITEYETSTIYIDEELDDFLLKKVLRHELMHVYLFESNKIKFIYTESDVCKITSKVAPLICKTVDDIVSKIKNI